MAAFAPEMNAKLYRIHCMWGRACESQIEYMCALSLFPSFTALKILATEGAGSTKLLPCSYIQEEHNNSGG